jgi:hypothetical protein
MVAGIEGCRDDRGFSSGSPLPPPDPSIEAGAIPKLFFIESARRDET